MSAVINTPLLLDMLPFPVSVLDKYSFELVQHFLKMHFLKGKTVHLHKHTVQQQKRKIHHQHKSFLLWFFRGFFPSFFPFYKSRFSCFGTIAFLCCIFDATPDKVFNLQWHFLSPSVPLCLAIPKSLEEIQTVISYLHSQEKLKSGRKLRIKNAPFTPFNPVLILLLWLQFLSTM